ncbi:MAG TPA: regulatory protein RecX [Acidothermaceae bacterium]|nr:regulatory protein RecX [Acidothermaceae bacterium]
MSGNFGSRRATGGARRLAGAGAGQRERAMPGDVNAQEDPDEPMADPTSVARSIGLDLLDRSPKTRAQLADAMRKRGVPDDAATEVLDRFGEVGLVDDQAFADAWVTSRQAGRGLAPRALANELRQRGVAEPMIVEALGRVDDEDVEEAARDLVTRRARSSAGLPTPTRMRRLVAMLNRKGYSGELAVRVVREVLAVDESDLDGPNDVVVGIFDRGH